MFKKNLKQLRLQCGFSQQELANAVNLSQSAINAWENGTSIASADCLIILSRFFEVTIEELLGIEALPTDKNDKIEILSLFNQLNKTNKTIAKNLLKALIQSEKEND